MIRSGDLTAGNVVLRLPIVNLKCMSNGVNPTTLTVDGSPPTSTNQILINDNSSYILSYDMSAMPLNNTTIENCKFILSTT